MFTVEKFIDALGYEIMYNIGTDSRDNFDIIDKANPNDIWFHVEGRTSGHVIAEIPEDLLLTKKLREYIVKQGAVLCKQYSKYASEKNVPIIWTKIENIEKTKVVGSVIAKNTKVVHI